MRTLIDPNVIRGMFSAAMSEMYRTEVPLYGDLLEIVGTVNADTLASDPELRSAMEQRGELERLDVERHGAIRVGTPDELSALRRIFAVMGMFPVGYYDLSVAAVPVHSTAFRPIDEAALNANPFRVFTSLLRLDLIPDPALREEAAAILSRRQIVSDRAMELVVKAEAEGGLEETDAKAFVTEVLETFRWHSEAAVSADAYQRLNAAHRLIADIVSFKGPHINHLTPRTLDIDAAQHQMQARGMEAKRVIEGPPRRTVPILLRQTSFKALEEAVHFADERGTHTARFGEIEQRGVALTPVGRALYDACLLEARAASAEPGKEYDAELRAAFARFPDDLETLRRENLAYFRYVPASEGAAADDGVSEPTIEALVERGLVRAEPIVYEDFLPVSAAGIFQSNLDGREQATFEGNSAQALFEQSLGTTVLDAFELYAKIETESRAASLAAFRAEPIPA